MRDAYVEICILSKNVRTLSCSIKSRNEKKINRLKIIWKKQIKKQFMIYKMISKIINTSILSEFSEEQFKKSRDESMSSIDETSTSEKKWKIQWKIHIQKYAYFQKMFVYCLVQ